MAYIVKRLLQTAPEELYWNTADKGAPDKIATNIVLCNLHGGVAKVYLFVIKKGGVIGEGAIVYGVDLAVSQTLEVRDRVIPSDYAIYAYCTTTADVVALSIDVIGDEGEFTV